MKKKFTLTLFIVVFLISGCSNEKDNFNNEQSQKNEQQKWQVNNQNQRPNFEENFDEVEYSALENGTKVMVMGTVNSDGSVVAQSIIIGDPKDFPQMNRNREEIQQQVSQQNEQNVNEQRGQKQDLAGGFGEMTPEMRQQMRAARQSGEFNRSQARTFRDGGASMVRLTGDVINKDQQSFSLKIDDGGSKIVFISDETKVLKPQEEKEGKNIE